MKLVVKFGPSALQQQVLVDGVDITNAVRDVELIATPEGARAVLVMVGDVDGEMSGGVADIVRRIPKEDANA
jgi:hypothetical protein